MPAERVVDKIHRLVQQSVLECGFRGSSLVVGVSGGADSLTLLHSLIHIQIPLGLRLHATHLNHGLYGESAEISAAVEAKFVNLGLPYTIQQVNTLKYKDQFKLSEEDAARRMRYKFLAEVRDKVGAQTVATGHTADDQAETVLLHLIRGSGLSGISGMRVLSRGRLGRDMPELAIFRPLLSIRKFETTAYCQSLGLDVVEDLANESLSYRRNRIRHELIPYLEQLNPRVVEALCRFAAVSSGYLELAVSETEKVWNTVTNRQAGRRMIIKEPFLRQQPVVQQEIVKKAVEEMLGDLRDVNYGHINEVIRLIKDRPGKTTYLPDNLVFVTNEEGGVFSYLQPR